jgi:hypothetical protein
VGESESNDNGRKRALSSTDNLAHVDGNLAVRGPGWHDGTVETTGWVGVTKSNKVNIFRDETNAIELTQILTGKQRRLFHGWYQ